MSVNNRINHVLIMAAGRGMRMRPLTDDVPKAMAPFQNETLIARGIKRMQKHVENIHVTVGYKSAMLAEHLMHTGITSIHNTEGHSNAWWVHNSLLAHLDEPIFVLTCDNIIDLDFDLLTHDYYETGTPACMLVPVRPVEGLEGDFIHHENRKVTRVQREEPTDIYCSGIQILTPKRVADATTDVTNFYDIWNQLIAQDQLFISSIYPKKWFAVDTMEQLKMVEDIHSQSQEQG